MSQFFNAAAGRTIIPLIPNGTHSATVNGNPVDVTDFDGNTLIVFNIAPTNSGGEVSLAIEHSDDGINWTKVPNAQFNPVTNDAASAGIRTVELSLDSVEGKIRAVATLKASTVGVFCVTFIAVERHQTEM